MSIADGQQLRGAEFYNCETCSKNCVGGSEQGCIPTNAPVGNPDLMGGEANGMVYAEAAGPGKATWLVACHPRRCRATLQTCKPDTSRCAQGMAPGKALAVPLPQASVAEDTHADSKPHKANPGHLLLSCHAFTLAALESVWQADFDKFDDKVTANAEAVTPVGAALLRQHVFAK